MLLQEKQNFDALFLLIFFSTKVFWLCKTFAVLEPNVHKYIFGKGKQVSSSSVKLSHRQEVQNIHIYCLDKWQAVILFESGSVKSSYFLFGKVSSCDTFSKKVSQLNTFSEKVWRKVFCCQTFMFFEKKVGQKTSSQKTVSFHSRECSFSLSVVLTHPQLSDLWPTLTRLNTLFTLVVIRTSPLFPVSSFP